MTKYKPLPSLERLNELLEVVDIPPDKYGVWSGLVCKASRGRQRAGNVAGWLKPRNRKNKRADWLVGIDNVYYVVSRVIYFMTYEEDPGEIEVDHEDQNPLNNNPYNLRLDINRIIQNINKSIQQNNTSGVMGVSWEKKTQKWRARLVTQSTLIHLGRFTCKREAASVINKKWIELGWVELGRKLNDLEAIACNCGKCT